MKTLPLLLCGATLCCEPLNSFAEDMGKIKKENERPNILWVTFEDTSAYEIGCYGNRGVHTPTIDSLARHSVQFMNAWSVSPQSSAARSSLITGCYASTYGMELHPVPFDTPDDIYFPQLLREAGYYCTNNHKTHYNSTTDNKSCWDECSKQASYNSRKRADNQPFFAVFNSLTSHMGRVRTFHTDGRRDYSTEGIYTQQLELPGYVPDLPEVRSDYAGHLEAVQDVDKWLGYFLRDLKEKGLEENTIIFFFSDHGGCVPRGKGYLYESGLRVPLLVYFPEKWKHLAKKAEGKDRQLVNFTDLGPTVLSLAGVKPPKRMHGKALFGKYADGKEKEIQFAVAANQLHHFMPVRAVTDGKYKYIRSYIPYKQFALRNYYQWGMPSNQAWDWLVLGEHNTEKEWNEPFERHQAEMLFDLESDPDELYDLSGKKEYRKRLLKMRNAVDKQIRETKDLGFFLPTTRRKGNLYESVRKEKYPLSRLYDLVDRASRAQKEDIEYFTEAVNSEYPEFRFWAAVGLAQLAVEKKLSEIPRGMMDRLKDEDPYVAAEAAFALTYLGEEKRGIEHLVRAEKEEDRKIGYSLLECISLDKEKKKAIEPFVSRLEKEEKMLPHIKNEDAGWMVRGILVNMGRWSIKDLYGREMYQKGLELNRGRRNMGPLPY